MRLAFLYAGQGSQKTGMGKDLYETYDTFRKVIDDAKLSFDVKTCMFEGPAEQLNETKYTQPCMAAFAAGMTALLKENGIEPEMAMGLSLGEYSALHAAGVFDTDTFLKLVEFRGNAMQQAAAGIECRMSAVLGLAREEVERVCEEVTAQCEANGQKVEVSNYNCPGQYVITGTKEAVAQAEEKALEAGAKRCMPLTVSGPFHTSFMAPAGDALREEFTHITWGEMRIPVIFNTTAHTLRDGETIAGLLERQVQSSIYIEDSIRALEEAGIEAVIEIGPGKVLSGFVKRTSKKMKMYAVEDVASLQKLLGQKEEILA
jgi:[acyl-carrier-protein] S-malonyltransferase